MSENVFKDPIYTVRLDKSIEGFPDVRRFVLAGFTAKQARDIVSWAILSAMSSKLPYTYWIDIIEKAM